MNYYKIIFFLLILFNSNLFNTQNKENIKESKEQEVLLNTLIENLKIQQNLLKQYKDSGSVSYSNLIPIYEKLLDIKNDYLIIEKYTKSLYLPEKQALIRLFKLLSAELKGLSS